jgi:hypothetical protein
MSNLTNVELNVCVVLRANSCILSFIENYPAWWEKFGIVLKLLISCMAGEVFDDPCAICVSCDPCAICVSCTAREVWGSSYAILESTVHFYCVMVIKLSKG